MDALHEFNDVERAIVDTLLAIMGSKPYEKVTVKELTGQSNVARTTFYRYFEDISNLVDRVERHLLDRLSLYRARAAALDDEYAGRPFESIERWFQTGLDLRAALGPLMGENGDVYFKERLQAQVRRELGAMMDDDRAPRDHLRPYYVASLAAAYIGLLGFAVGVEDESQLISAHDMAVIANSGRAAYYRCTDGAPSISNEKLFGQQLGN